MNFDQIKKIGGAIHKVVKEVAPWAGIGGVTWSLVKDRHNNSHLKLSDGNNDHHIPLSRDEADHIERGGTCHIKYGCGSSIRVNE